MMKKTLITVLILAAISLTVKSCMAVLPKKNMNPSDYDMGMTYETARAAGLPIILVFYTDWCTYCKKFMPKLDSVRNMYKGEFNVVLINTDSVKHRRLSDEFHVEYLPTVYISDPKYDYRSHIDSSFADTVESFAREVGRYAKIRRLIDKGYKCGE